MTKGIEFANKMSSRNQAVVVADHGDKLEILVWINPTTRFRSNTEMVEKKWVRKEFNLSGVQTRKLEEVMMGVAA